MRTLTATLEAAQRAVVQRPRVRVKIRDKMPRWSGLGYQSAQNVQSAVCAVGSNCIVVATLDTSGVVRVRRVTAPGSLGAGVGWGHHPDDFTTVVSGVVPWPTGDVALSYNGTTLRLFYIKSSTQIACRTSTDGGETWSAEEIVKTVVGARTQWYLASAGQDDIFWYGHKSGDRFVYYRKRSGGSWGSEVKLSALNGGGEFNNLGGIGVQYGAGDGTLFAVVVSAWGEANEYGRIITAKFDASAGSLSSVQKIVPPGSALAGFTPWYPCLFYTTVALGSHWVLTYLDEWDDPRSDAEWSTPVAIMSRDFEHWSYRIPMAFDVTYDRRMALVQFNSVLYCHTVQDVDKLDLWYEGKPDYEMAESSSRVLRYKIREQVHFGDLTLELDNRDGRYDSPGVPGAAAAAMRPLAQVIIDQGLNTSAGDEYVEQRPFYLWHTARIRSERENWLQVYAVDGWTLLRLWRPDSTWSFENKTLRWCIAELLARVGYWIVDFDEGSAWDTVLTSVVMSGKESDWDLDGTNRELGRTTNIEATRFGTQDSGFTILMRLLNVVGGVARFGHQNNTERVYCFIPAEQGTNPTAAYTYLDMEIIAGRYLDAFPWPTRVRATGAESGIMYQGVDVADGQEVGMEFFQSLYSADWLTAAQCQVAVESALDDADARAYGGWIKTRPNLGLELWDVIVFSDSRAGGGLTNLKRRANEIGTQYDPLKSVWEQGVRLEGV